MRLKIRKIVYDWKSFFFGFSFGVVFMEAHASGTQVIKFSNTLLFSNSIDWKTKIKGRKLEKFLIVEKVVREGFSVASFLHLCNDAEDIIECETIVKKNSN